MIALALGLVLTVVWCSPAAALVEYYLDPDYSGTHTGTAAQPFSALDSGAWTIINSALAGDNVTLYCSARNAGSDTNQNWGVDVDVTLKTANPGFRLTFNGRSKYNSNDANPSWLPYSGTSRCSVHSFSSQNTLHTKYNMVTVDGFAIAQPGGSKGIAICGDDWIVQNNDISHTNTATDGPLVLLVPTADAAHGGSGSWCQKSSRITIQNNVIHDSFGEGVYIGGAGCAVNDATLSDTNCNGKPGHDIVNVLNNTISNTGRWGGEGDGIDVKAAITNLTIRGNTVHDTAASTRGIVLQGIQTGGNQATVIERNNVYSIPALDAGIALANSWGTANGVEIRNNLVSGVTGRGILAYDAQSSVGVFFSNNTVYNCSDLGLHSAGTITARNNALLSNNSGGNQALLQGTPVVDHNGYSGTWSGTCTSCVSGLSSADFTNVATRDFTLTGGSILRDVGTTLSTFTNDYAGGTRPVNSVWDIGAYEYGAAGAPTGLVVQ